VTLDKGTARSVEKICFEGDRLMMVKLSGKPVDVVIVLVYMPTTEHTDEEIEEMYERLKSCSTERQKETITRWS